ncbi:MAG TPA: twin-arginine translocase TatA/TatE family subunit [Acidobacteriaceae bacterium]|nr:twin-arginine translocase TatA/TatE family subunit [Acidobacteriaceae bacterium]
MPSFADSIFLFVLALLLFGPKKLPVLARELGKWMGEFRRASNEFKMQMDEELRLSEQTERQKQIAAMEAAAPIPPPLGEPAEPEHPHLRHHATAAAPEPAIAADPIPEALPEHSILPPETEAIPAAGAEGAEGVRPLPIATSGSLKMMPPATGLPTPRSSRPNALSELVDAIPEASPNGSHTGGEATPESIVHGD